MKMFKRGKMVTVATSLLTLASVGLTPITNSVNVVMADTTSNSSKDDSKVSATDMSQSNVLRMVQIGQTKNFRDKAEKYGTSQQKSAFKQALDAADKAANAKTPSTDELRSTGMALYRSMTGIDNAAKLNLVKLNDKANKAVSGMDDDQNHDDLDRAINNVNLVLSNLSASLDNIQGAERALTNSMVAAGIMKAPDNSNSNSSNNNNNSSSDNDNSSSDTNISKKDQDTIKNGGDYTGNFVKGDPTEGEGDAHGNDVQDSSLTGDPTKNNSHTNNSGTKSDSNSNSGNSNNGDSNKSDNSNSSDNKSNNKSDNKSDNKSSSSSSSPEDNDLDYIDEQTLKDTIHQAEMPEMQMLSSMAGTDDRKALATAIIAANKAVGADKLTMTIANTNLKRAMQFIKNDAKKALNDQVQQMTAISKTPAFNKLDQKVQSAFNDALMKASTVNADPEATYADILNATKDSSVVLQDIYSKADKTDLNATIEQIGNLKDSNTWNSIPRKSKSMLNRALAKAEDVSANAGATQDNVDEATKDLRSAEIQALSDAISTMKDTIKNGKTAKESTGRVVRTAASSGKSGSSDNSGSGSSDNSDSSNGGKRSSKGSSGSNGSSSSSDDSGSGSSDNSGSGDSSQSAQPKSQSAKALPQTGRYIMRHAKAIMAGLAAGMAGLAGYAVYDKKRDKKADKKEN